MHASQIGIKTNSSACDNDLSMAPAPSTPNGLSTGGSSPRGPGIKASESAHNAMPPMASHTTGRQRREGGLPSGNSTGMNAKQERKLASPVHDPTQSASSPPGKDPGSTRRA